MRAALLLFFTRSGINVGEKRHSARRKSIKQMNSPNKTIKNILPPYYIKYDTPIFAKLTISQKGDGRTGGEELYL